MFILNVTTHVHWSIHEAWVQWMQQEHMPDMVATGCFERYQLVRLLETDETEGPTYAVQYFSPAQDDYTRYQELHAARLREESLKKWGEYCISFRSLMRVVN
jgi:Domain of unknown function (DUF4286)